MNKFNRKGFWPTCIDLIKEHSDTIKSPPWTRGLLSLAALMARPLGAEIESLLPLALPPTFSNVRDSGSAHACRHARTFARTHESHGKAGS
jgi:hypothetical protein